MYTISLPVKPYVKRFLELNFEYRTDTDDHIQIFDFKSDKKLYAFFRKCLIKPEFTYDKTKFCEISGYYSEKIKVVVSESDFYRYGWEISNTDIVKIGKELETSAKFFMKNIISCYCSHMEFSRAVNLFQEKYGFTEDIWSYQSIKKDFQRNALKMKIDFSTEITEKIEKIFLLNLYKKGTISTNIIKNYAGNK